MNKIVIGEFNRNGPNVIDINLLKKKWNKTWFLSNYAGNVNTWQLVKMAKSNSKNIHFKSLITVDQAKAIINKIGLSSIKSKTFTNGTTWKKL